MVKVLDQTAPALSAKQDVWRSWPGELSQITTVSKKIKLHLPLVRSTQYVSRSWPGELSQITTVSKKTKLHLPLVRSTQYVWRSWPGELSQITTVSKKTVCGKPFSPTYVSNENQTKNTKRRVGVKIRNDKM